MESQCNWHCLTPFREVWPTACRVVQRLTAEAAIIGYHISTRHAIGKTSTEKPPVVTSPPGVNWFIDTIRALQRPPRPLKIRCCTCRQLNRCLLGSVNGCNRNSENAGPREHFHHHDLCQSGRRTGEKQPQKVHCIARIFTTNLRPYAQLRPIYDPFSCSILHYQTSEKPRYINLCRLYRGFYVGGVREI